MGSFRIYIQRLCNKWEGEPAQWNWIIWRTQKSPYHIHPCSSAYIHAQGILPSSRYETRYWTIFKIPPAAIQSSAFITPLSASVIPLLGEPARMIDWCFSSISLMLLNLTRFGFSETLAPDLGRGCTPVRLPRPNSHEPRGFLRKN